MGNKDATTVDAIQEYNEEENVYLARELQMYAQKPNVHTMWNI